MRDLPVQRLEGLSNECRGLRYLGLQADNSRPRNGVLETQDAAFRVTTGRSLTRAHRFYEKQGAVRVGTIQIHQGESTAVYAYRSERPGSDGKNAQL